MNKLCEESFWKSERPNSSVDIGLAKSVTKKEDDWDFGAWSKDEDASTPRSSWPDFRDSLSSSSSRTDDSSYSSHTTFSSATEVRKEPFEHGDISRISLSRLDPEDSMDSPCGDINHSRPNSPAGLSPSICSNPFDRESTYSLVQEDDSGGSDGAHGEDEFDGYTPSPSPGHDAWLTVAYAKHRMLVALMRDVYAIFNSQWTAEIRNRTGSQAPSAGAYSQDSGLGTPSSSKNGKRQMEDRGSPPPDGNDTKKRKKASLKSGDGSEGRCLACCFYKYNAHKYCSNSDTGTKYRSCAGPGFTKIAQLK